MKDDTFNIVSSFSDPFFLLNQSGSILERNAGFDLLFKQCESLPENIYDWPQETAYAPSMLKKKLHSGVSFFHQFSVFNHTEPELRVRVEAVPYHKHEQDDSLLYLCTLKKIGQQGQDRQRLGLLEKILEAAKDVILIADAEPIDAESGGPTVIEVNPAFTEMTGYLPEDIIGKTPRILQGEATNRQELDKIKHALENWQPIEAELINYRKDGTPFWMSLIITPIADDKGWFTHWVSIQRDITQQKSDQQTLAKISVLLNETQKFSKTGGWELDIKTGHTIWTEEIYRIHEVPRSFDHNKENGISFYHPDDQPILIEAINRAISHGEEFDIVCRFFSANRKLKIVKVTGHPIFEGAQVVKLIGVIQDISQQIETEEGLITLTERFQLAVRAANMGVWDYYPQENNLEWDDNMYALYGVKKEDFSGAYDAWASCLHPDSFQQTQEGLFAALENDQEYHAEFEIILPNGERRILAGEAVIKRNEQGEAIRVIGVNYDITERKMAEFELLSAKEAAEQASQTKSEFLSTMSHEIRTPLNAVVGVSGLLGDTDLDAEQADLVKTIRLGGESLLSIINDILDFSKIEAGKIELEQIAFDIRSLLEDAVDLLYNQAFSKRIELLYHIEDDCDGKYIGDNGRLRQVLVNLIGNAIKFTEQGEVRVKLRKTEEQNDQSVFEFSIIDTGIGIPQAKMDHLFQSFSQVDASTTRRYGGTGLGLAISKKLISLMGGDITVESEVGKGTTFFVTLPLEKAKIDASTRVDISSRFQQGQDIQAIDDTLKNKYLDLSGFTVLLVEDNIINQKVAQKMLKKFNLEVEVASNGQEGLDFVCMRTFDLVFMDMQMPVMDGLESTRRIRAMHTKINQPAIIAMTANSSTEDKEKCIQVGMDDFISKPITIDIVTQTLSRWLRAPQENIR